MGLQLAECPDRQCDDCVCIRQVVSRKFYSRPLSPRYPPGACNEISPSPTIGGIPLSGLDLKCYAISTARGQTGNSTPPPRYTVTDGLLGTDPNVTGSSVQYVCAPAQFTQP